LPIHYGTFGDSEEDLWVFTGETANAKVKSSKNFLSPDLIWPNFGGFLGLVSGGTKYFNFYHKRRSLLNFGRVSHFCPKMYVWKIISTARILHDIFPKKYFFLPGLGGGHVPFLPLPPPSTPMIFTPKGTSLPKSALFKPLCVTFCWGSCPPGVLLKKQKVTEPPIGMMCRR